MGYIRLNTRQRDILLALLESKMPLTLASLAAQLNLSPRIIRYNLETVKTWLCHAEVPVVHKQGYGIIVEASQTERRRLVARIDDLEDVELLLTPKQRLRSVLLDLLASSGPITSSEMAERTKVSRTTIFKDIQRAEAWLGQHGLKLKRCPKKGLWIEGGESKRRSSLFELLWEELWPNGWYDSSNRPKPTTLANRSATGQFELFIRDLELSFCQRVVDRIERGIGQGLNYDSRMALQIYLALTIQALQQGQVADDLSHHVSSEIKEYQIAQIVACEIERQFDLRLPRSEVQRIAVHLMGSPRAYDYDRLLSSGVTDLDVDPEVVALAKRLVAEAALYLHPCLNTDQELIYGLGLHLSAMVSRLRHGLVIHNAMLRSIQETYPDIYEVAERPAAVMAQRLERQIPEEEVGYLAMHLAAALERLRSTTYRRHAVMLLILDSDISNLILLHSRLRTELPNLDVIEVRNWQDRKMRPPRQTELILSTVPLEGQQLPIIQISPLLDRTEVEAIKEWLRVKEEEERKVVLHGTDSPSVVDLLDISSIVVGSQVPNWREAVVSAAQPLVDAGKIEPSYVVEMQEIIVKHGPYMVLAPGTALIHAKPSDGVKRLCLGLLLAEVGVPFGHAEFDPVDIIFVLGAIDHQAHVTALWQLIELIRKPEFAHELRQVHDAGEALRVVWFHLSHL